jgi:class 3 adenylate cyclase/TolB-like protein/Tfp pilus assembly protein PilF
MIDRSKRFSHQIWSRLGDTLPESDLYNSNRRLATIMVADIVGYSRLMEADEEGTYATLRAIRSEIVDPGMEASGGRTIKHLGDGFLAEFPSVMAALQFARSLQEKMRLRNEEVSEIRQFSFRLGINLGDVIVDESGDIFGDGVNVAARLESLALPGGICISAAVRDSVHKKIEAHFEDLGDQQVKNIQTPVRAYRMQWPREGERHVGKSKPTGKLSFFGELKRRNVFRVAITHVTDRRLYVITIGVIIVALVLIAFDRFWLDSRKSEQVAPVANLETELKDTERVTKDRETDPRPSIAVLPFANRSANPDDAFFVDGIHDDLLTHISRIGAIKTISRTSVMQYRDSDKSIPEIASELGVSTVLEGGVQRAGNQIRLNVQLIDARTDEHIWAEIYDRQLSAGNIFAIQSEISGAISEALKAKLSPQEKKRTLDIPTEDLNAYEAYLIGRQRMAQRNTESLADAVAYFTTAVEIDSQFAIAWAALGDTYLLQRQTTSASEVDLLQKAQAAIEKALNLEPELGEAYASLGMLHWNLDEVNLAEQSFRKAIELAPNYATAYHWYSILLRSQGRSEEATEMIATAAQLDPMSPVIRQNLAIAYRSDGRHQEALKELEKIIAINPEFVNAYEAIATIEHQVFNRMTKAVQVYSAAIELDPTDSFKYAWLGQVYLDLGAPDRASDLFDRARNLVPDGFSDGWGGLLTQVNRGDLDNISGNAAIIMQSAGTGEWIGQFTAAQLRNQALANDQYPQALAVYSTSYPQLLDDPDLTIGLHNYRAAIDLSLVLQKLGKREQAHRMLERCHEFIRGQPRLGWWGGYWAADVLILALQGEKAEALSALQNAVDENWRSLWWYYLRHDPNLDSIRDEPLFQQALAQIEADMSTQLQDIRRMEQNGEIAAIPGVNFDLK